jgi:hypothetical protein
MGGGGSLAANRSNYKDGDCMTPEQFKERWDSSDDGGGITMNEIADCAKEWGLFRRPRTMSPVVVLLAVLARAGCDVTGYEVEDDR